MEDLNGIRKHLKKSRRLKRRLHSLPFRKIQTIMEYKACLEGIEVKHLTKEETRNASKICYECGHVAREVNACLNLLKAQDESLWFGLDRFAGVAVIRPLSKAVSKSGEVKLQGSTEPVCIIFN